MDYNLLNGGLILNVAGNLIISDIKNYTTRFRTETDGMFWFMNTDGGSVYYSDQKRCNALCMMDIDRQKEEVVLDKPCYGLVLNNDWLYYINENDKKVYRCLKNGRSETKIIDAEVGCFIIEEECIFYSTPQGIYTSTESGSDREKLSDSLASSMLFINEKLVFSDKNKHNVLTILDLNSDNVNRVDGIAPSSMNTDGRYIYCANRLNERSIYRVEPEKGNSIRICGESAEFLHVIDNELYFCIYHEWHRMSLAGGQPEKVVR